MAVRNNATNRFNHALVHTTYTDSPSMVRFTETAPGLVDVGVGFVEILYRNATANGARLFNNTVESLESLTGPRVLQAATAALEPGGAVSVLAVTFSLLACTRMLIARKEVSASMRAHSDLR
jgi:hypothetical protein